MTDPSGNPQGPVPPKLPKERPGPPGGKRDQNRRERTRVLMEAALGQFLQDGIEAVPVEAITKAAGVAKGTFYRYFADKRQLVRALLEPAQEGLLRAFAACRLALAAADESPGELVLAYASLGQELVALLRAHRGVAQLYLQESRAPAVGARVPVSELAEAIGLAAVQLTEGAQARGLLRPGDPTVSAYAVVGAAERLLQAHLAGRLERDEGEVVGELIGLVLQGLRPEP